MGLAIDIRTAPPAELEKARQASYERASPAGKKAQGAFALWAAANQIPLDDTNRLIAHDKMQFALGLPDCSGSDIAQAAERGASELGLWNVYDVLRQPSEKLFLIMAVG